MKLISTILGVACLAFVGCAMFIPGPHPALIIPDGYTGEVFIVPNSNMGIEWKGQALHVSPNGIVYVSDLRALASIRPDAYEARYVSGRSLGNRNRGGSYDQVGLWPVAQVGDEDSLKVIFFVIGTFHNKTELENMRMRKGYQDILACAEGKP